MKADEWRSKNKERIRLQNKNWHLKNPGHGTTFYDHKSGRTRPMSDAKDCSYYLGVYIAERVLSKFFDNMIRMPSNNPGFDFTCGKGFKINVKSSVLHLYEEKNSPRWMFSVKYNKTADYFLFLAFDNRQSLEPQHIWLVPGNVVNEHSCISISDTTWGLSKFLEFEKPLDKVVACCNLMKKEAASV